MTQETQTRALWQPRGLDGEGGRRKNQGGDTGKPNCGVGEDLRVPWTARRSSQSILKEISPEHSLEGLMLKLNSNTLATWCEEPTHWKRPWCWGRLKARGEGDDRGWDGWMASPTQWTWVWASSRSWWWTGKPVVLQSMGSQRVGHNWATELNWTGERQGWEKGALVPVLFLSCWPWGVLGERLSSLQLLLTKHDPQSVILSPQSFRDYITRLSLRPGAIGSIQKEPEHGLGPSCGGRWKQGSV